VKLTRRTYPEAIKRYDHIRPARVSEGDRCAVACPGTLGRCSLAKGHTGPHVAHGHFARVVAVWGSDRTGQESGRAPSGTPVPARRGGTKRPIGLRAKKPAGIRETLWERVREAISSADEFIFLLLFVAFVAFVIHWALLILG
jgi:hypothetical protein